MKCPVCQGRVSSLAVLRQGTARQTCPNCESPLRVSGLTAFLVAPMIVFFFFPAYALSDDPGLIMLIAACAVVILYAISFALFVELEREGSLPSSSNNPAAPHPTSDDGDRFK
jgi:hypothetical protein